MHRHTYVHAHATRPHTLPRAAGRRIDDEDFFGEKLRGGGKKCFWLMLKCVSISAGSCGFPCLRSVGRPAHNCYRSSNYCDICTKILVFFPSLLFFALLESCSYYSCASLSCLSFLSLWSFVRFFFWNVDCLENLGEGTDHGLELSKREGMTEKWKKIRP